MVLVTLAALAVLAALAILAALALVAPEAGLVEWLCLHFCL